MLIGMTGLIYCTQGGFYILIFVDIFANVIPYMMIFMFEITFLSIMKVIY